MTTPNSKDSELVSALFRAPSTVAVQAAASGSDPSHESKDPFPSATQAAAADDEAALEADTLDESLERPPEMTDTWWRRLTEVRARTPSPPPPNPCPQAPPQLCLLYLESTKS